MPGAPAVFLDRDGVINRAMIQNGRPYPPQRLDEVEILPGAIWLCEQLAGKGYLLIGVTNQPDVARGQQSVDVVEAINDLILARLPIKEILVCYHDDKDNCDCRKPKPGLIFWAASRYHVDMPSSWMVGDRWKDIAAGAAAGLRTIFVDYDYNETYKGPQADYVVTDVAEAEKIILRKGKK